MNKSVIPEYELAIEGQRVGFVIRTAQEIDVKNGGRPDVPHRHNYYTVLFVKRGSGRHIVDYHEYEIEDNSLFFVSPGQVHQVLNNPGIEGFVLLFTKDFLQQHHLSESLITDIGLFSNVYNVPPILMCEESRTKMELFLETIAQVARSSDPYREEAISAYLKLFFIECNRYALHLPIIEGVDGNAVKTTVKEFKLLLERNYANWHKVGLYAEALNVSSDYLSSLMKASVGKSAKEFIQNRIALEAKRLGVHTSLTSKEIAYQLGFDDPAHFSKFYKGITNQSFSDFRSEVNKMSIGGNQ